MAQIREEKRMTATGSSSDRTPPAPLRIVARVINPLIKRLAGKRHVRAFAVIEHRGRRSGRVYATPVAARPTAGGFLVPMAFGERADWFRNVQAAGSCIIRWNGSDYAVDDPEIIDWEAAKPTFTRIERIFAPLFADHFVRLRFAAARPYGAASHQ
jgi:deazaflavin-dependent oxidoreductase (nitroreductase family)